MKDKLRPEPTVGIGEKSAVDLVLMVEDERDHAELVMDALQEVVGIKRVIVIDNGETALDYMFRKGDYVDKTLSPRPRLILLDINLPGKNGLEVLRIIRNDKRFSTIPIVILTTSPSADAVKQTADLGANDYVIKPTDFSEFLKRVTGLGKYWSTVSALTMQTEVGQ